MNLEGIINEEISKNSHLYNNITYSLEGTRKNNEKNNLEPNSNANTNNNNIINLCEENNNSSKNSNNLGENQVSFNSKSLLSQKSLNLLNSQLLLEFKCLECLNQGDYINSSKENLCSSCYNKIDKSSSDYILSFSYKEKRRKALEFNLFKEEFKSFLDDSNYYNKNIDYIIHNIKLLRKDTSKMHKYFKDKDLNKILYPNKSNINEIRTNKNKVLEENDEILKMIYNEIQRNREHKELEEMNSSISNINNVNNKEYTLLGKKRISSLDTEYLDKRMEELFIELSNSFENRSKKLYQQMNKIIYLQMINNSKQRKETNINTIQLTLNQLRFKKEENDEYNKELRMFYDKLTKPSSSNNQTNNINNTSNIRNDIDNNDEKEDKKQNTAYARAQELSKSYNRFYENLIVNREKILAIFNDYKYNTNRCNNININNHNSNNNLAIRSNKYNDFIDLSNCEFDFNKIDMNDIEGMNSSYTNELDLNQRLNNPVSKNNNLELVEEQDTDEEELIVIRTKKNNKRKNSKAKDNKNRSKIVNLTSGKKNKDHDYTHNSPNTKDELDDKIQDKMLLETVQALTNEEQRIKNKYNKIVNFHNKSGKKKKTSNNDNSNINSNDTYSHSHNNKSISNGIYYEKVSRAKSNLSRSLAKYKNDYTNTSNISSVDTKQQPSEIIVNSKSNIKDEDEEKDKDIDSYVDSNNTEDYKDPEILELKNNLQYMTRTVIRIKNKIPLSSKDIDKIERINKLYLRKRRKLGNAKKMMFESALDLIRKKTDIIRGLQNQDSHKVVSNNDDIRKEKNDKNNEEDDLERKKILEYQAKVLENMKLYDSVFDNTYNNKEEKEKDNASKEDKSDFVLYKGNRKKIINVSLLSDSKHNNKANNNIATDNKNNNISSRNQTQIKNTIIIDNREPNTINKTNNNIITKQKEVSNISKTDHPSVSNNKDIEEKEKEKEKELEPIDYEKEILRKIENNEVNDNEYIPSEFYDKLLDDILLSNMKTNEEKRRINDSLNNTLNYTNSSFSSAKNRNQLSNFLKEFNSTLPDLNQRKIKTPIEPMSLRPRSTNINNISGFSNLANSNNNISDNDNNVNNTSSNINDVNDNSNISNNNISTNLLLSQEENILLPDKVKELITIYSNPRFNIDMSPTIKFDFPDIEDLINNNSESSAVEKQYRLLTIGEKKKLKIPLTLEEITKIAFYFNYTQIKKYIERHAYIPKIQLSFDEKFKPSKADFITDSKACVNINYDIKSFQKLPEDLISPYKAKYPIILFSNEVCFKKTYKWKIRVNKLIGHLSFGLCKKQEALLDIISLKDMESFLLNHTLSVSNNKLSFNFYSCHFRNVFFDIREGDVFEMFFVDCIANSREGRFIITKESDGLMFVFKGVFKDLILYPFFALNTNGDEVEFIN